jgi:hypothetical protein
MMGEGWQAWHGRVSASSVRPRDRGRAHPARPAPDFLSTSPQAIPRGDLPKIPLGAVPGLAPHRASQVPGPGGEPAARSTGADCGAAGSPSRAEKARP